MTYGNRLFIVQLQDVTGILLESVQAGSDSCLVVIGTLHNSSSGTRQNTLDHGVFGAIEEYGQVGRRNLALEFNALILLARVAIDEETLGRTLGTCNCIAEQSKNFLIGHQTAAFHNGQQLATLIRAGGDLEIDKDFKILLS